MGSDREEIRGARGRDGLHQTEGTGTVTSDGRGVIPFFFYVTILDVRFGTRLYIVKSGHRILGVEHLKFLYQIIHYHIWYYVCNT